ncbi:MAG TPA: 3-hydroxyacyl-CoA dehydrogenase family protein [Actinomycetes bacterium]|nr:3-hydroxyacyl-CoA dehydrogenase family protein [Actinomycetes bacterium]
MPDVVGVVGAGLMGAGIAQVSAQAGYQVRLYDVDEGKVHQGLAGIERSVKKLVDKGTLNQDADALTARIAPTTSMADLGDVFIAVEAVFERLEVKQDVFRSLDEITPASAILATNTSALPITKIAEVTSRPDRVIGTHFFSPVPRMQLCELVRGERTSDETLAEARSFAENVGKTCVVVNRDIAGFVTTRLITALVVEASRLLEDGVASAEDIDVACRLGFGHAMGPLETMDLIGIDVMVNAADNIAAETPGSTFEAPELLRTMVAQGRLGRKSGRGFYEY